MNTTTEDAADLEPERTNMASWHPIVIAAASPWVNISPVISQGMDPLPRAKNTTKMSVVAIKNGPLESPFSRFWAMMISIAINRVPTEKRQFEDKE